MRAVHTFQVLLAILIAGAGPTQLFAQTPGVECGCEETGNYVAPKSKGIKVENLPSTQEAIAPGGIYTLETTSALSPNISHITIKEGSSTILSISSRATGWGFSPDGNRFVMHGMDAANKHWLMLYNLNPDPSVSGENALLVRETDPSSLTSASIRFSPHGHYLLYAGLGNSGALMLFVYNTTYEDVAYSEVGGTAIVGFPSGKSIAGWGFSPDTADRTFVHAFLSDAETYALIAFNLETKEDVFRSLNNTGIADFRFSPCGDYFLWSTKEGLANRHCYFYKTSEPNNNFDEHFSGDELEYVKTDGDNHKVKFFNDNTEYTFANTADDACSDQDPPTWPGGAELTATDASGTSIDLSWDAATDSESAVSYRVFQDENLIMEFEANTTCQVSDLTPSHSYDFKVQAGDKSGNWTSNGPSLNNTYTEADLPPEWTMASLSAPDIQGNQMTLEWNLNEVTDDWGITEFKIYRNGEVAGIVDGEESSYTVRGLLPLDTDTFKVEAGDAASHWTINGPQLIATTLADNPPTWPDEQIYAEELTETSISFSWNAASDDYGVKKYRISNASSELAVLSARDTNYTATDLEAGQSYFFKIEAGDEALGDAGNWSLPISTELMTMASHVELPLIVNAGYQGLPDIDDKLVVWSDNRNGNNDIFKYNLVSQAEDDLITNPEWQGQANSSGGRIVWTDMRNGNSDIYMYDMYDPYHQEVVICDDPGDQTTPVIDGNIIVWADYRSGNWDIYMLDLLTMEEKAVCTNSSSQFSPDVSEGIIVWEDNRHGNKDIYGYVVATEKEFEVCKHSGQQQNPTIERKPEYRILWQDDRDGDWDIYMRVWYVNSYEILKVYLNYSGNQINPDIDDEILVFQDDKGGDWDIYAYNFRSRTYGSMEAICTEPGDQMNPRTSKSRIVWEDRRNDDGDIYIWDRPPGTDLSLALEESADPIALEKTLVYTLIAHNDGPDREDSARVMCTLPVISQLTNSVASAGTIDHTGLTLEWFIGSLPADSSEVLELHLKTFDLATLNFRSSIEGNGFDMDPSNNRLAETTEVKLVVGETLGNGMSPALFVDQSGKVHIGYGSEDSLIYASKLLYGSWLTEDLVSSYEYQYGDIVMDNNGKLHICYSDKDPDNSSIKRLNYTTNMNQETWKNRIIALSVGGFSHISMAYNNQGTMHMMYQESRGAANSAPFMYMNSQAGSWNHPVLFYDDGYDHIDMAVDKEGYAHTVYFNSGIEGVTYQKSMDTGISGWLTAEFIEPDWGGGQLEGMVVDIALDSSSTPHIIYPGNTEGYSGEDINYARRINESWVYEQIDNGGFQSAGNAIAVEPSGIVHVCYSHIPSSQIRYATNIAGSWIKQTLERDGYSRDLAMELDSYGNVHITYTHDGVVKYALRPPIEFLSVEPDTLDFGIVQINESKQLYLNLVNESSERILIDAVEMLDEAGFIVNFSPFELLRGEQDSILITYSPGDNMKSNSNLRIWFTSNSKLFMDIPVKASTPIPKLLVEPEEVNFGKVPLFSHDFLTATLSNIGSNDLIISDIYVLNMVGSYEIKTDFSLASENCTTLGPGESCQVEIEFYPRKSDQQLSYLNILSNDPENSYRKVQIRGYSGNPSALIYVKPSPLSFGYIEANASITENLWIYNYGDADLSISNTTLTGTNADQFASTNSCTTIPPADSCMMSVDFSPDFSGDFSATLNIYSNSQYWNPKIVSLDGNSSLKQLAASETEIDFGEKLIGEDSMVVVTLSNPGDHDLTISEISIVGRDLLEFLHTGWNGTLAPDESINDTLWFAPIFKGEKSAMLRVVSNDSQTPELDIPLSGIASEGDLALKVVATAVPESGLAPLTVDFSSIASGGSPPYSFLWDFGNEESSTLSNPTWVFTETGTYVVHITVMDATGTSVEDFLSVNVVDAFYSISGSIMNEEGTTGITEGWVELYIDQTYLMVDEMQLSGSEAYTFTDLAEGDYTVRYLPDNAAYPDALPTYIGEALMMIDATFVNINSDLLNQDINVQNKPVPGLGAGYIAGVLIEGAEGKKSSLKIGIAADSDATLEGVSVYLKDNGNGSLAGSAVTDLEGHFEFGTLVESSYIFLADYMAMPMNESNPLLNISDSKDSISIVATVSSTDITTEIVVTGIHNSMLSDGFEIFPNPARDILYIRADRKQIREGINRIFIIGINGNVLVSEYFFNAGVDEAQISLVNIPAGIYLLRLEGKTGFYNAKIVIME